MKTLEELGYELVQDQPDALVYEKMNSNENIYNRIVFWLNTRTIEPESLIRYRVEMDMPTLNAINLKIRELGWMADDTSKYGIVVITKKSFRESTKSRELDVKCYGGVDKSTREFIESIVKDGNMRGWSPSKTAKRVLENITCAGFSRVIGESYSDGDETAYYEIWRKEYAWV